MPCSTLVYLLRHYGASTGRLSTMARKKAKRRAVSLPPEGSAVYINADQLKLMFPISDMTLWRWQADPRVNFPVAVKLGAAGRNYWWLPDLVEWRRAREAVATVEREPIAPQPGPKPRDDHEQPDDALSAIIAAWVGEDHPSPAAAE
jgi:hypothetical protein